MNKLSWAVVAAFGLLASGCSCGPAKCSITNCKGCCDSAGACVTSPSNTACGTGGATCQVCTGNQVCEASGSCSAPGGDGGIDAGFMGTYDQWCTQTMTAICQNALNCGLALNSGVADCTTYFERLFCNQPTVDASLSKGYSTFDTVGAQQCLDFVHSQDCDNLGAGLFFGGCATLTPNQAEGQPCLTSADCAVPTDGCGGSGCSRTCTPAGMLGGPCARNLTCADGSWCSGGGLCQAPQPAGSPCTGNSSYECDAASYCNFTTRLCTALPALGQPCSPSGLCVSSAYCSGGMCAARLATGVSCVNSFSGCVAGDYCPLSTQTCQTQLAAGSSCMFPGDCQSGLTCKAGGSCAALSSSGGACTSATDCVQGLNCFNAACRAPAGVNGACASSFDCTLGLFCEGVSGTCQASVQNVDLGGSCTDARGCALPGTCVGMVLGPVGGRPGICQALTVGSPCALGDSCPEHAACLLANDAGSCQTAVLGSPCSTTANCPPNAFCDPAGTCRAQVGLGQVCDNQSNASCASGTHCYSTDAGSQCAAIRMAGAACNAILDSQPCPLPLVCVNSVCSAAGETGQPCFAGGGTPTCYDGACQPDAGICGAPSPSGAPCSLSPDCASELCVAGTCAAVCP